MKAKRKRRRIKAPRGSWKKNSMFLLIILSALQFACDRGTENLQLGENQSAMSETSSEEANSGDDTLTAEPPTPVLGVYWENVGTAESPYVGEDLRLVIKNNAKIDLPVSAKLDIGGLLKHEAKLNLAQINLQPDEEVVLPVNAKDLPIQVLVGVGQISADVVATIEKDSGPVKWIAPVSTIYFQHKPDYNSIEILEEDALLETGNAHMSGLPEGVENTNQILGRVKNTSDEFNNVYPEDCVIVTKNEEGEVAGYITGVSLSTDSEMQNEEVQ